MNFVIFTCSTINDQFLFNKDTPWKYVSLDPNGNNLESDLPRIKRIRGRIIILIGNTDPYYIYSQDFKIYSPLKRGFLWRKYDQRWQKYKNNLTRWLKDKGLKNYRVISWREFELDLKMKVCVDFEMLFNFFLPKIDVFFSSSDFRWEINKLKQNFNPQGYFKSLTRPNIKTLNIWVRRKFTEYMIQGLFIYLFLPNAVLIQNEKPTTLRNKMYQPLVKRLLRKELPIICPFGIDDSGYQ